MRYLVCSTYTAQQEAAAHQLALRSAATLTSRSPLARLREAFLGPTPTERLHYQQQATFDAEARRWAKGQLGEELLFHTLGRMLDDSYLLLLDYPSPERRGDIDSMLIGPHGVTVCEVKAWTGTFQASDHGWSYLSHQQGKAEWVPAREGNPTQQVLRHAEDLRRLLRQANLATVPVIPVIVIASEQMEVQVKAPHPVPLYFFWGPSAGAEILLTKPPGSPELTSGLQQRVEAHFLEPMRTRPPVAPPVLPKTAAQLLEEGDTLSRAGLTEAAISRYEYALRLEPASALVHNAMGASFTLLKRYPEALAACDQALRLNPRLAAAHSNRGLALLKLGHHQEAISACDRALQLDPRLAVAYNNKGLALLETHAEQEALLAFEAALTLRPTFTLAWVNKGVTLKRMGRNAEAEEALQRAQKLGYVPGPGSH